VTTIDCLQKRSRLVKGERVRASEAIETERPSFGRLTAGFEPKKKLLFRDRRKDTLSRYANSRDSTAGAFHEFAPAESCSGTWYDQPLPCRAATTSHFLPVTQCRSRLRAGLPAWRAYRAARHIDEGGRDHARGSQSGTAAKLTTRFIRLSLLKPGMHRNMHLMKEDRLRQPELDDGGYRALLKRSCRCFQPVQR
jgi:hypothetical protein